MRKNYITIAAALTLIFFLSYCTKSKENQNDYIISVDIEQKDKISFLIYFQDRYHTSGNDRHFSY